MKSTLVSEASTDRHSASQSHASDIYSTYISKRLRAAKSDAARFVSRRSRDPGFHDQEHRHTAVITPHLPHTSSGARYLSGMRTRSPANQLAVPIPWVALHGGTAAAVAAAAAAYIARWWLVADLEPGRLLCWPGDVAGPGPRNTSRWVCTCTCIRDARGVPTSRDTV
jgi:hypothetical protein